jgi:hypothetical protein
LAAPWPVEIVGGGLDKRHALAEQGKKRVLIVRFSAEWDRTLMVAPGPNGIGIHTHLREPYNIMALFGEKPWPQSS